MVDDRQVDLRSLATEAVSEKQPDILRQLFEDLFANRNQLKFRKVIQEVPNEWLCVRRMADFTWNYEGHSAATRQERGGCHKKWRPG